MIDFIYKKGDVLTNAIEGSIIVHSCNTLGKWGAGFAKQLANMFPEAYKEHKDADLHLGGSVYHVVRLDSGLCMLVDLITSAGYGSRKSSTEDIVKHTCDAILRMVNTMPTHTNPMRIVSPKINAGLFGVPWEKTEQALIDVSRRFKQPVEWIVYEL